jgi:peroxiredoxin
LFVTLSNAVNTGQSQSTEVKYMSVHPSIRESVCPDQVKARSSQDRSIQVILGVVVELMKKWKKKDLFIDPLCGTY